MGTVLFTVERESMENIMALLVLVSILAVVNGFVTKQSVRVKGSVESNDWDGFKAKFGKVYSSVEEDIHRQAFLDNIEWINKHNIEYDDGKHTYWCGANKYTDLTDDEWEGMMGIKSEDDLPRYSQQRGVEGPPAPDAIDWRTKGAVNAIKDQGQCGSCWAFSAVLALEGAWFISKGNLPDASEQQLVSCDRSCHGCSGGLPANAYEYLRGQTVCGIDTSASIPYTAQDDSCDIAKTTDLKDVAATTIGGSSVVGDDEAHKSALANVGPLSICVHVSDGFRHYSGGVFDDPECTGRISHAVGLVGYGDNVYYLRNSWGESWGVGGYMDIIMGKDMCSMLGHTVYPVI